MATLEKIRSKSVLLFVIIIVALLAFILGDFLTSGRTYFGSGMTVAKAGKVKVQYPEYQNRISELSEQYRNQGQNNISSDRISAQALEALIVEGLMNQEYNDLGIVVTDNELAELISGPNQHPQAAQTIAYLSQALGLQAPDAAAVHDAINNPARYSITQQDAAQIATAWQNMETQLEDQLKQAKFGSLMSGLFTYNKLDAQSIYNDVATTRHIAYVAKDASSVNDSTITVNDADVRALWSDRQGTYALDEETRLIDYIMVRIEPSREDRLNAANTVEEALLALNTTPGIEAITNNTRFIIENGSAPMSALANQNLKNFLDTAAVGQAAKLQTLSDSYMLGKLLAVSTGIDSLNVSFVQTAPETNLDSIVAAINAGAKASEFTDEATMRGVDSLWQSLINTNMPEGIANALTNAQIGKAFAYTDSINGDYVFLVNKRNAPVKVYDFCVATYNVDPSQQTLDELSENLRTYVSNHSSAADFANPDNTREAGYAIMTNEVTPSSAAIGNVADSRRFVKWAFEAGKGQVSPVFQDDKQTYLIAMALNDIYKNYRPYTNNRVYTLLESEALNSKKADKLLAEYAGQADNLAGYAEAMGTTVSEGDVNFTNPMLLNIGFAESALAGAIASAPEGQLIGPMKTNRGIVVFEVQSTDTTNRPFTEEEYGQQFMRTFNPVGNQGPRAFLLGKNKVKNRSLDFIANPADN